MYPREHFSVFWVLWSEDKEVKLKKKKKWIDYIQWPLPVNHCLSGMGVSTVSAARILRGQMEGGSGEETMLAMDTFPYVALSKVTTQHC